MYIYIYKALSSRPRVIGREDRTQTRPGDPWTRQVLSHVVQAFCRREARSDAMIRCAYVCWLCISTKVFSYAVQAWRVRGKILSELWY